MFENSLGRKKREELGDQILMKQMHGFKSAECYCSTLGLTAGSEDSLAEAQSCSWKPPGAPFCSPIACPVSGVGSRALCPPAVLLSSLHVRLFWEVYLLLHFSA